MNQKYTFNTEFFKTWTPEMAYVIGWILTDGCIEYVPRKRYVIRFDLAEKQPLEIIKRLLDADYPIREEQRRDSTFYSIMLRSQVAVQSLMAIGITPNKTFTAQVPDMPKNCRREFIRGVFEGDGSVFILNRAKGRKLLNTKFSSASEDFIRGIGNILYEDLGLMPKIYSRVDNRTEDGNTYWELRYGGRESMALYYYMYKDATFYLERKKAKFEEAQELKAGTGLALCLRCGKDMVRLGATHKWCSDCKPHVVREQWKINGERKKARRAAKH